MYVDPETFQPVELHAPPLLALPSPARGGVIQLPSGVVIGLGDPESDRPIARVDVVDRYLTFEYLPRSEANLALTDIRTQHPGATEIEE